MGKICVTKEKLGGLLFVFSPDTDAKQTGESA